jgi:hypothetical protein
MSIGLLLLFAKKTLMLPSGAISWTDLRVCSTETKLHAAQGGMTIHTFCGHLIHQSFDGNVIMDPQTEQIRQT